MVNAPPPAASATLSCPALLVCAPASGQGKTTVVAALARLYVRSGRRVRVFKCGPDFLDPQIHALASGAPCETLDLRMAGADDARWRLARAAREADLILIEGVMGLHDGEPSAAQLARQFGIPLLLVLDAAAMAGCFGAVAWGLKHYRAEQGEGAPIAYVLANRVGSDYHARLCRDTLPADIAWLGALPRSAELSLPERHLGLYPAAEIDDLDTRLNQWAEQLGAHLGADFGADRHDGTTGTTSLAALPAAVHFADVPEPVIAPDLAGQRIAIARDAAFCFLYPANLACLRALGAQLVFFSPLAGDALPECDAVWLPGGYPELHAARLSACLGPQGPLRQQLARHVAADKPLLAECGGMMVLFEQLIDLDGASHALAGLLPGSVRMQARLAGLGMLQVSLPEGEFSGHTFHYSQCSTPAPVLALASNPRGRPGEAVYRQQRLTASYLHFYFAGNPAATARLLGRTPGA